MLIAIKTLHGSITHKHASASYESTKVHLWEIFLENERISQKEKLKSPTCAGHCTFIKYGRMEIWNRTTTKSKQLIFQEKQKGI